MDQDVKCKIREKRSEKPKMDMQGHPAHSPTIVIPRAFRWTFTNENHPEIHYWMRTMKTDYVNKKIILEVMDDAKGTVFDWLQALVDKNKNASTATLTHFDGAGTPITIINFVGLKIEEHLTEYDYGSSEVLTNKVVLSYYKTSRINQVNVN